VKKDLTQTEDPGVKHWLDRLSKKALGDLVIDLVRIGEGDETLDGAELCRRLHAAAEPVMLARDDKLPPADDWEQAMEKTARVDGRGHPDWAAKVRACVTSWRPGRS